MSEDIKKQIESAVKTSIEEHLPAAIENTLPPIVQQVVNGKIDALRREVAANNTEQTNAIESQNLRLKRIEAGTNEMIELFTETSGFFKVIMRIAKFLIPVGSAGGIIWGIVKFFKLI